MNLDTTIDIDLKKFFRWWGGELAFLLPNSLRQRLRYKQGNVIFTVNAQGFKAVVQDNDANVITQQLLEHNRPEHWLKLTQQFPAISKADIVVRLSSAEALQKVIYLPIAAQENLQQVVAFELDRYTPFTADQVYFAAVPLGNTEYAQLSVLLIVVPKAWLDSQLMALTTLGVQPHRVDFADALNAFPQTDRSYNLLPNRFRQHQGKWQQSLSWLTGFALLTLALAALVLPVWQQGQAVDSLKQRIKQLEKQNRVVDTQQSEIDAVRAETQQLIDIKQQAPGLLAVLSELSHLLKDDTWLTHLHFSDKHLQIQGQSPAASALISLLEASEYFSDVSFVSPLTQDKTTGRERFQISMTVTMVNDMATGTANEAVEGEPVVEAPLVEDTSMPDAIEEQTGE